MFDYKTRTLCYFIPKLLKNEHSTQLEKIPKQVEYESANRVQVCFMI